MTAREEARRAAESAARRRAGVDKPPRLICRAVNRWGNRCTGEAIDGWSELPLCSRHEAMVLRSLVDTGVVTLKTGRAS